MSEPLSTPFLAVPGLTTFGDDAAGFCADGQCVVPDAAAPGPREASPGEREAGG